MSQLCAWIGAGTSSTTSGTTCSTSRFFPGNKGAHATASTSTHASVSAQMNASVNAQGNTGVSGVTRRSHSHSRCTLTTPSVPSTASVSACGPAKRRKELSRSISSGSSTTQSRQSMVGACAGLRPCTCNKSVVLEKSEGKSEGKSREKSDEKSGGTSEGKPEEKSGGTSEKTSEGKSEGKSQGKSEGKTNEKSGVTRNKKPENLSVAERGNPVFSQQGDFRFTDYHPDSSNAAGGNVQQHAIQIKEEFQMAENDEEITPTKPAEQNLRKGKADLPPVTKCEWEDCAANFETQDELVKVSILL